MAVVLQSSYDLPMRIGEVAAEVGVSTKTIRYYESIGLLAEPARSASGYRQYEPAVVERLHFIRDAQASGLRLDEIASVLELKGEGKRSCAHTAELLERHLNDLDDQIARLEQARGAMRTLAARAASLDPARCTDPNRCQVISADPAAI